MGGRTIGEDHLVAGVRGGGLLLKVGLYRIGSEILMIPKRRGKRTTHLEDTVAHGNLTKGSLTIDVIQEKT